MADVQITANMIVDAAQARAELNKKIKDLQKEASSQSGIRIPISFVRQSYRQLSSDIKKEQNQMEAELRRGSKLAEAYGQSYVTKQQIAINSLGGSADLSAKLAAVQSQQQAMQNMVMSAGTSNQASLPALKAQYDSLTASVRAYGDALSLARAAESNNKQTMSKLAVYGKLYNRVFDLQQKYADGLTRLGNKDLLTKLNGIMQGLNSKNYPGGIMQAQTDISDLEKEMRMAGVTTEKFGERMNNLFGKQLQSAAVMLAINLLRRGLVDIFNNVKDINSALTQLQIVSGESGSRLTQFGKQAAQVAKDTSVSVTSVLSSSETYARLGYSLDDSLGLARSTNIYANIADTDIETATSSITAIMKGYDLDASAVGRVTDILSYVGAKYAVSASELGEALQSAGATLEAGGNTLEQSVAIIAAGNAAIQDASKVGNAVKTSSMRIRGATADLEEAGEDVDEFVTSTSKMRDTVMGLSGVDIMKDANTFKSTYDILVEISNVWDKLTDVNQASLLEALAGKRNASVIKSIITNVDDLKDAYADAMEEADGYAEQSQLIFEDSIAGRIGELKAGWEDFSQVFANSGSIKSTVSALSWILSGVTNITDAIGGLSVALIALGGYQILRSLSAIKTALAALGSGASMASKMSTVISSSAGGWITLLLAAVAAAAGAIQSAQEKKRTQQQQKHTDAIQDSKDIKEWSKVLDEYEKEIVTLKESMNDKASSFQEIYDARTRLGEIREDLVDHYGTEDRATTVINNFIDGDAAAADSANALGALDWENYKIQNREQIEKAAQYEHGDNMYYTTPLYNLDDEEVAALMQEGDIGLLLNPRSTKISGSTEDIESALRRWYALVAETNPAATGVLDQLAKDIAYLSAQRAEYDEIWDSTVSQYMAYESSNAGAYEYAKELLNASKTDKTAEGRQGYLEKFVRLANTYLNSENTNVIEKDAFQQLTSLIPNYEAYLAYYTGSKDEFETAANAMKVSGKDGLSQLDELAEKYNTTAKELRGVLENLGLIEPEPFQESMSTLLDDILDTTEALEGATEAKKRFDAALEGPDVGDAFKGYAEMFKTAQEYGDKGYFGSKKFQSAVKELLGDDALASIGYDYEAAWKMIQDNQFLQAAFSEGGEDYGSGALAALKKFYADADGIIRNGNDQVAHFSIDESGKEWFTIDDIGGLASRVGMVADAFIALMDAAGIATGAVETTADEARAVLDAMKALDEEVYSVSDGITTINLDKFLSAAVGSGIFDVESIYNIINALAQLEGYEFNDPENMIGNSSKLIDRINGLKDEIFGSGNNVVSSPLPQENAETLQPAIVPVNSDTGPFMSGVLAAIAAVDGMSATVTINANGRFVSFDVGEIFGSTGSSSGSSSSSSASTPYSDKPGKNTSHGNLPAGSVSFRSNALGTRNAPSGPALVNDGLDGAELIVDNGRAYIANDGLPTIVNLSQGATVYTGTETKRIMNGGKIKRYLPAYGSGLIGIRWRPDGDSGNNGSGQDYISISDGATVPVLPSTHATTAIKKPKKPDYESDIKAVEYLLDLYKSLLNYYEEGSDIWIERQTEIIAKYQTAAEITEKEYNRLLKAGTKATDENMMKIAQSLLNYQEDVFESSEKLWDAIRENHIDELKYQKDLTSSVIDLTEAHHDLTKAIREERLELESELKASRDAYSDVLTPSELDAMFSAEDYAELSAELDSLQSDAERMYADYYATINSIGEDEKEKIEFITDEFQRQYDLKMKEYEVAKAELAVKRAEIALQNTQNEHNVAMLVGGKWTWVADPDAVLKAEESLKDAMLDLADAEDEKQYGETVAALESTNSTLQLQIDALEALVFTMDDLAMEIHELVDSIQENVLKTLTDYAKERINNQSVAVPQFATGGVIDSGGLAIVDDGELLLNSEDASKLYKLVHNGGLASNASVAMQSIRARLFGDGVAAGGVTHDNRLYINGINVTGQDADSLISALSRVVPMWQPT